MTLTAIYPSLKDKVVFITGGGSGIGACLVEAFARQGAKVAFVDIAVPASEALVKRLKDESSASVLFLPCDITDIEALRRAMLDGKLGAGELNYSSDIDLIVFYDPDVGALADDGEILLKGELVMIGYWNNPAETAKTVVDGWLHTGDIGHLDERGRIVITDRKKDIIVNDKGDNVAPQRIEGMLTLQPEIAQAMLRIVQ